MDGSHAEVAGARIWHLDTGGSGTPVVLLHPHTGTSATLLPQLEALADAGRRAITFDRRGSGQTESTGEEQSTAADDLDALLDYLGVDRFHLVGVAAGAFVAVDYAAWRPGRVRSLVTGATMLAITEPGFREFSERILIPGTLDRPDLHELSAGYRGGDPDGVARWLEIERSAHRRGERPQPLRSPNTYAKIATVDAPTLVIAGGADLIAPPALMRMWSAHLPHGEFAIFPEAGHAITWEDPELSFTSTLLGFLARH